MKKSDLLKASWSDNQIVHMRRVADLLLLV